MTAPPVLASEARSAVVPTAEASGSNSWAEDVMDFVAREHANVREHLGHMLAIAAPAPGDGPHDRRRRLDAVFGFLHADLPTLMTFEEEILYPALDRIPDVPRSRHAMAEEHAAIRDAISELDDVAGAVGWERGDRRLGRSLVGLQAVVRLHVDTEERLYGPLLSRLDPDDHARLHAQIAVFRAARLGAGPGQ
jgi:Hemerythrin HHE cation binding domain